MTSEQKKALIAALLEEKRGYVMYGRDDRAAEVDKQLRALGHGGKPPAKRATQMMSPPPSEKL
jgi:hypothetical protein